MLSWVYLIIAIILEVAGTIAIKLSEGFTKIVPTILLCIFYLASFFALSLALKKLDVSLTYAVWSGLGTVMIAIIGIYFFHEPCNPAKLISIGLIVLGVIGLHFGGV